MKQQKIWQECIDNFEEYMEQMIRNNPANGNLLNKFRQEISDSCRQAAETNRDLYRLTVPTGAGKHSAVFVLHYTMQKR